jgi:hypothetical protein
MSKSMEFVKNRISNKQADVPLQENAVFTEVNFLDAINNLAVSDVLKNFFGKYHNIHYILKDAKMTFYGEEVTCDIPVSIFYDENAEFEYFTMEHCICDGTLLFMEELCLDILNKVFRLQTINKEKVNANTDLFKNEIIYTVGNFVVCTEYGDFGTEDKPWLNSRFTVMLPIKFDLKKLI